MCIYTYIYLLYIYIPTCSPKHLGCSVLQFWAVPSRGSASAPRPGRCRRRGDSTLRKQGPGAGRFGRRKGDSVRGAVSIVLPRFFEMFISIHGSADL